MPKKRTIIEEDIDSSQTSDPIVETPPKEPEIDTEALRNEIREQVSNEIRDQVSAEAKEAAINQLKDQLSPLFGSSKAEEKTLSQEVVERYGQTPTLDQQYEFLLDKAAQKVRSQQEEESRRAAEQEEAQRKAAGEANDYWHKVWQAEYESMVESNLLPKVADEKSATDEGVRARDELFTTFATIAKEATDKGERPPQSLYEIYTRHYQKKSNPAADAPVGAGSGNTNIGGINKGSQSIKDILRGIFHGDDN